MSTLFSRIIRGEIPGRFVWSDERCVAFLTIAPLRPGHVLVVPRDEVNEWTDADDDLVAQLRETGGGYQPNVIGSDYSDVGHCPRSLTLCYAKPPGGGRFRDG